MLRLFLWPLAGVAILAAAWLAFWRPGRESLVVYCAHDSIYSESVLRDFEKRTGIPVAIRFDTEATKSLGLVELLIREKDAPRCDVFWNNELLGTMDLAARGVLEPYRGPGWERIPAQWKDPEGRWTGFAARMRVKIFNPQKTAAREASENARTTRDLSRFAIAKPLYGTTLTHYAVTWALHGREKTIAWHRDWRARGVREVNGNAAVKDMVAAGSCDFGFTDSDDFFVARDAGQPVDMVPVRVGGERTICIPNTVAIIRATPRRAAAEKLTDFLLSAETELALARSKSRQIPLGPVGDPELAAEVRELRAAAQDAIPLREMAAARAECLAWLKTEYAP